MATANTNQTTGRNGKATAATSKSKAATAKARKMTGNASAATAPVSIPPWESATQAGGAVLDWPAENVELNRSLRHRLYDFLESQPDIDLHVLHGMEDGGAEIDFYPRGGGAMNRLTLTIAG